MKYIIMDAIGNTFMVYLVTPTTYTCVKTFKTRKAAENWVRKHS